MQSAYHQWGSSLYIVLGGDINIVPARLCEGIEKFLFPADPYYANVTGNHSWNNNGNHIYGEYTKDGNPSHENNLNLGRLPVKNNKEARNLVDKIISYEKAAGVISDLSYYRNRLIVGAQISPDYYDTDAMSGLYSYYTSYIQDYAEARFLFDSWKVVTNPDPLCSLLTRENFLSALENGISPIQHFHIVYHMDHSGTQAMGAATKERTESISNADVDNLRNGKFYQIIMSGGCNPGNFQKDCIAEHFLNNPNGGAVAFIGNTDSGWSSEYRQYDAFEKALLQSNLYNLGDAYKKALIRLGEASGKTWRLHLFGDPQMCVWTDTPKQLNANVSSQCDEYGNYQVTVALNQSLPEDAAICFYKEGDLYYTEPLRSGTTVYRPVPYLSGTLHVTITGKNYLPHETAIEIAPTEHNHSLVIDSILIDDGFSTGSVGNRNRKIDAGETIEMTIRLKYIGTSCVEVYSGFEYDPNQITLYTDNLYWERMCPNETADATLRFQVKKDVTESLVSDQKGIRLKFYHTEFPTNYSMYVKDIELDVYQSDLHAEEREVVYTENGNLTIEPGELVKMNITLANYMQGAGAGITATLQGTHVPLCSASYPDIDGNGRALNTQPFQFRVSNSYQAGTPLLATLTIRNQYGKTWEYSLNLTEKPDAIVDNTFKYTCNESSIQVYWGYNSQLSGYNVFRSDANEDDSDSGNYRKLNHAPLTFAYYTDTDVIPYKRYYYKVTTLSTSGAESAYSKGLIASTSHKTTGLYPVPAMNTLDWRIDNSTLVADINDDGYAELFTAATSTGSTPKAMVIVKNINGDDLFDIDSNVTTHSGFTEIPNAAASNPAITRLTDTGEYLMFFVNRKESGGSTLFCYSLQDLDRDGKPDMKWKKKISGSSFISAVVAEDLDGDGKKEIILRGEEGHHYIHVYFPLKDSLYSIACESSYASIAVADLNGDGKKEIIAGTSTGVHIYQANGTPYSTNPVFTQSEYNFRYSSPVVCDLDNDGQKEIVLMGRINNSASTVFAFKPNGSIVTGWNGSQHSEFSLSSSNAFQNLAVGDLDHDGKLEVVVPGVGNVRIWKNNGTLLSKIDVDALHKQNSPILADVDEEDQLEIIINSGEKIYAFHPDGTNVKGFPVVLEDETRSCASVADIDNDGKNELIASSRSQMYVWKTPGDADKIEWGMDRFNVRNTGEYVRSCTPLTVRANTTWNQSYNACGDLTVSAGILTLNTGCVVRVDTDKKLIVRNGGTLFLNGGQIENANILVESGGKIQIQNQGRITLRKSGRYDIRKGAILEHASGAILITP